MSYKELNFDSHNLTVALSEVKQMFRMHFGQGCRYMARRFYEEALAVDFDGFLNADRHERTGRRRGYRNGYRSRSLLTSVGALDIRVPRDCKGKAHQRYEFGCEVSIVSTSRDNWVIGAQAHHGSPYDGHTLRASLDQATRLTGGTITDAYCDRGYRGATKTAPAGVTVHLVGRKRKGLTRSQKKWLKRRSAIEPIIGRLKEEHRMDRNHFLGREGDRINVLLCGCGFNMRKLLRAFLCFLFGWLIFGPKYDHNQRLVLPATFSCA